MSELEEREREETFRLKRFKNSKAMKADKANSSKGAKGKMKAPCTESLESIPQLIDIKEPDICCPLSPLSVEEYDICDSGEEDEFVCPICKLVAEASYSTKEIKVNLIPCQKCLSEAPSAQERLEHLMSHMSELLKTDSQCKKKVSDNDKRQDSYCCKNSQEELEHIPTDLPQLIGTISSKSNDSCTQQASDSCTCESAHGSEQTPCSCPSLDIILKSSRTSQHSEDSCTCLTTKESKKSISFNIASEPNEPKEICSCSLGKETNDSASSSCCEQQSKQHSSTDSCCSQTPKSKSACSNNYATYVAIVSQVSPFSLRTQKINFKSNNPSEVPNIGIISNEMDRLLHSEEQLYRLCFNKKSQHVDPIDISRSLLYYIDLENSECDMIEPSSLSDCMASNSESTCIDKKQNSSNMPYRQKPFIYYIREEIPARYGESMHNTARDRDIASHSTFLSYTRREPSLCGISISNTITNYNTFDVSCRKLHRKNNSHPNNTNKMSCDVTSLEPYTREGKPGPCGLFLKFPSNRSGFHEIRHLPTCIRTYKEDIYNLRESSQKNVAGVIFFQSTTGPGQPGSCCISDSKSADIPLVKNQLVAYTREGKPGPCGIDYGANSIFARTLPRTRMTNVSAFRISIDQNLEKDYHALFRNNEFLQTMNQHISSGAVSAKICQGLVNMSLNRSTPYITLSMPPTVSVHYATCQTRLHATMNKATEVYLVSRRTQTSLDSIPSLAKTQDNILKAAVPYLSKNPTSYITLAESSKASVHSLVCEICLQAATNIASEGNSTPTHESQHPSILDNMKTEIAKPYAPYSCQGTYGSLDYSSLLPRILANIQKASAAYMKDESKNVCSVKYKHSIPTEYGYCESQMQSLCCKPLSSPQSKSTQYPCFTTSTSRTNLNSHFEKSAAYNKAITELLIKPDSSITKIDLGYFETKSKEITKVSRFKNLDGTYTDKKQIITIKTEKIHPQDHCIKVIPCLSMPGCDTFDYSDISKSNNLNRSLSRQISDMSTDSEKSNTSVYSDAFGECDRSTSMSLSFINSLYTSQGYAPISEPTLGSRSARCHSIFQKVKRSHSDFLSCNISNCPKINNHSDRINEGADVLQNLSVYNCTAKPSKTASKKQTSACTSTSNLKPEPKKSKSVCNIITPSASKSCCQKPKEEDEAQNSTSSCCHKPKEVPLKPTNCGRKSKEEEVPLKPSNCCPKPKEEIVLKGSDLDTLRKILLPSKSGNGSANKKCEKCESAMHKSTTTESLPCPSCVKPAEKPKDKLNDYCCAKQPEPPKPKKPASCCTIKSEISGRGQGQCGASKTDSKQTTSKDKIGKSCQCAGKCKHCQSKNAKPSGPGQKKTVKDSSTSTRLKDRYDVRPAVSGNSGGKDKPKRCDCQSVCKC